MLSSSSSSVRNYFAVPQGRRFRQLFNGVGTPQTQGNRLTLVMVTVDEAQAVLIPLGR